MQEVQQDPLELKGFKQRKAPRLANSPPKTILHSPPRKLTAKDQEDWEIPPCVSNFTNPKSLTIPLDKRVLADGRNLKQNTTVNERFAKQANAFYIVEREVRKEISERNRTRELEARKKFIREENRAREAANLARQEKAKILPGVKEEPETGNLNKRLSPYMLEDEEGKTERDVMRYIKRREIERERRTEVSKRKKSKASRDGERDISERIALGQAQSAFSKGDMFDQRLFNQTSGLDSGFGDEGSHSIYDKPLLADRSATASIYQYRPERDLNRSKSKGRQDKPIEFEKYM